MTIKNPISPKVLAAAGGAGAGAIVSQLVLWIIGVTFFDVDYHAEYVDAAVAAVPSTLAGFIQLALTVIGAWIPGYQINDPNRLTDENVQAGNVVNPAEPEVADIQDPYAQAGVPSVDPEAGN